MGDSAICLFPAGLPRLVHTALAAGFQKQRQGAGPASQITSEASTSVIFALVPSAKASHLAQPRVTWAGPLGAGQRPRAQRLRKFGSCSLYTEKDQFIKVQLDDVPQMGHPYSQQHPNPKSETWPEPPPPLRVPPALIPDHVDESCWSFELV